MKVGAVKVHVRLTNGVDDGLVRTGQLNESDVRSFEGEALVDTALPSRSFQLNPKHPDGPVVRV